MKICIATPTPAGSRSGNRATASRWAGILRESGHTVQVTGQYESQRCDLLVALHARRSYPSVASYRRRYPHAPLIVGLAGTDLYHDLPKSKKAMRSLELADRLVVLQMAGVDELPSEHRSKAVVIFQSAEASKRKPTPLKRTFEVTVLGHLRPVKDPFRAAMAARGLPRSSRIQITQLGAALSSGMQRRAQIEQARNPRYRWLGNRPRSQALNILARSRLTVVSSRLEGGPNVVSEAVAGGVPVVSSEISGVVGMLGENYPGYFPVGDTAALRELLSRAETDLTFYEQLGEACRQVASRFDRSLEQQSWRRLLARLG